MNSPPRIFIRDKQNNQRSLLLDLNPQFKDLMFGRVENITFRASDGHTVKAGLYRPPDFATGKKYPLVIQTHAWNPERFWIDGPYSTAFAAQPLAGRGFLVLQLEEDLSRISGPGEYEQEMAAYQGAIDYLDGLQLIDLNRLGILGFSRTGLTVKYTLTHSRFHFAAATVADGSDGGYFAYLAMLNSIGGSSLDFERVNGAPPFGTGLAQWFNNSPGFNLEKVTTPLRLEADHPGSLFFAWEWFVGLHRLDKPVDLIYMPEADHVLVKPYERLVSQQGNVDWFRFWLKGEEDPDPAKAEQYARWRELRKLQEKNEKIPAQSVSQ